MDPVTFSGGAGLSYPDSVDSSPRSRGGESWDEPFPSSAAASSSSKLRLMCSYGGRIVPRPTDKSLCYLGGDTRIVVVDRHSSLSELHSKLSRSLLDNRPFTLKYQLPNEDLDSLISVTTDEDLDNMIEEYDRIAQSTSQSGNPTSTTKSSRIRLFLFPTKPESAPSSIGSLLDDSKSETWFVDALNGAMAIGIDGLPRGLSTDSASVNCLLGLEDDSSVHSRIGVGSSAKTDLPRPDSSGKLARQDVHSVPDSPMLDTMSSFGSTSSAPSLSNLPPIRIRPDDRPPDQRYGNLDDHFRQMNLSSAQNSNPSPNQISPPIPLPTAVASTPTISPTENPNRVFGSDEEKPDPRKPSPPQPQVTSQQKPPPIEAPLSDQRPVYYQQERNPISEPKREIPVSDPAATYRMQQVPEPGYVMPTMSAPDQLHPHTHPHQQQQQQQFIPANSHFVPMPSYYQMPHPLQQTQPFDHQIPMYYLPVRQNQPGKPELQPNLYRTAAPPAPMIHVAAGDQGLAYTGMGYHLMHHHHPSQAAAQPMASYGYANAGAPQADTMHHPQVYYTQTTSPPSMPAQYQTVNSDAPQVGEVKQNRSS